MDAQGFDRIAKTLSRGIDRRRALAGLVGGLLAGGLGRQGTLAQDAPQPCFHSTGPYGGCKGACTSAGFTGRECNPICGSGQFRGYCPVGQGGNNPCCNPGLCEPANFVAGAGGNPVYVGPTSGC